METLDTQIHLPAAMEDTGPPVAVVNLLIHPVAVMEDTEVDPPVAAVILLIHPAAVMEEPEVDPAVAVSRTQTPTVEDISSEGGASETGSG